MNSEATLGRRRHNPPQVCARNSPAGGSMHPLSVAPFAAVPYVNSGPVPKALGHRLPMQHARKWTARKMKSSNGFIQPAGSDCSRHPSVWPRLGDNVCVRACVCFVITRYSTATSQNRSGRIRWCQDHLCRDFSQGMKAPKPPGADDKHVAYHEPDKHARPFIVRNSCVLDGCGAHMCVNGCSQSE